MPPTPLFPIHDADRGRVLFDHAEIYRRLPHRFEFSLLSGISFLDKAAGKGIAFCLVTSDQWWVRGHVPGDPIFPGILMLEAAAQAAAYFTRYVHGRTEFIAFGGVDECKFRDIVRPPARLDILCQEIENRHRRVRCATQGWIGDRIVFEAKVSGLPIVEQPGA